jgi:AraC-like DNA-binding protein
MLFILPLNKLAALFVLDAMHFDFSFYSSLLLIFFVHGLVYAALLLRKGIRNESRSDKWLSLFLFLCSLFIAPWMLGFAGWYDNQPYRDLLFYIPMQNLYLMGPVIFFYVQSLLNPSFRFGKKDWLHLLPGMLYLLYSLIMFVTDQLILKRYYFLADNMDRDFDYWYQATGLLSMLVYFFISLRYYSLFQKLMLQVVSYADTILFRWVKNFLLAFLMMQVLHIGFEIFSVIFPILKSYVGSWWFFFCFAVISYYIAITGYSNSIETKVPFKLNLRGYKPLLLLQYSAAETGKNNFIEDVEVIEIAGEQIGKEEDSSLLAEWKPKIEAMLKNEKAYEAAELSLTQVAKQLKTNPSVISRVINQGFQVNFNDFVNNYRIEAVKEKLLVGEQKTQTLLGIAYDCGFNSKATFNRAFKKATGSSPKEWIEINTTAAITQI